MTLTLIAVLIALGLMAMAFTFKVVWLFIGAGGFWIILGIFAMAESPEASMEWGLGIMYFGLSLMCLTSFFWFKDRSKDASDDMDVDDEEQRLYRQHMNDMRRKGREM